MGTRAAAARLYGGGITWLFVVSFVVLLFVCVCVCGQF